MTPIVRFYGSEQQAQSAARELEEWGFEPTVLGPPDGGDAVAVVRSAVSSGGVAGRHSAVCRRGLERGRWLVSVGAPFGSALKAEGLLGKHGPVDTDVIASSASPRDPSPFSDILGMPVLADFSPSTDLSIVKYTFGEPGVSSRSARAPARSFGLPTLTRARSKRSSFGLPLLSRNPAPLSSMFGLPTLRKFNSAKRTSFGLPRLSQNPAPASSLFGLRTISRSRRRRD